jgi:hypothetical protein
MPNRPILHKVLRIVIASALLALLSATMYWAIIGYSLDRSIRSYTEECIKHLQDPTTQTCVVAFIPISKKDLSR